MEIITKLSLLVFSILVDRSHENDSKTFVELIFFFFYSVAFNTTTLTREVSLDLFVKPCFLRKGE